MLGRADRPGARVDLDEGGNGVQRGGFPAACLVVEPASIRRNVATIRAHTDAELMAVVKANGYGHGVLTVARTALEAGVSWLGTTDFSDAVRLRSAGITVPILCWLNPSGVDAVLAATHGVDIAVGSVDELAQILRDASSEVRVHLQFDTGMARGGAPPSDWDRLAFLAQEGERRGTIRVVGVMGHLPHADSADPQANAHGVELMRQAIRTTVAAGLRPSVRHLAATSAALTDSVTHFDMVRIGAGLVGIDPSGCTPLCGAATLTVPIVHSAEVLAGTPVGYGGTYVTDRATNLGVLGIGYADGIPRNLSSAAEVAVEGRRHPVVGRVSMDQIVIDTGLIRYPRGTVATVFASDQRMGPTIHDWAYWADTIPHTVITGIGPRVTRGTR